MAATPSEQDIIDIIINEITANGNNEITGDVLRPILITMVEDTRNVTGLLDDLETTDKNNLVDAINEVRNIAVDGTGVIISYGTGTPQETPPPTVILGQFYAKVMPPAILGFWQWNGQEWVEITPKNPNTYKSIDDLKLATNKEIGDYVYTESFYEGQKLGGAVYEKVDTTGLTPNDQDIIELNNGDYVQLKSKEVNPFMFGALEEDNNFTATLQAYFDYVRDNDVIGDFRGNWVVDDMITIDGLGKTFQCGNIYAVNSGLEVTVKITTGYSLFYGEFQVMGNEGSNVTNYTSRTSNIGVLMETQSGRNYFERFNIRSFKSWGIKGYGAGATSSLIMNWIGSAKIWNCGSGYSTTRENKFNIISYSNNGGANSINQTATITAENAIEDVYYKGYIEINGRLHKIITTDIPNKQLTIFPWVDTTIPDPTITPFEVTAYNGGGILIEGGNSANFRIDQIDSIGVGTCVADYGLYGATIGDLQAQFCMISYAFGEGSSLGGEVNVYSEAAQYSIVQREFTSSNSTSNRIIKLKVASGDRVGIDSIDFTGSPYSSGNTKSWNKTLQATLWYQDAFISPKLNLSGGVLPSAVVMGNSNIDCKNNYSTFANGLDVELKWNESENKVFGLQSFVLRLVGTGASGAPTGALNFTLDADDQTSGITVNGAAFVSFTGFNEPVTVIGVFDYANNNWVVHVATGIASAGGGGVQTQNLPNTDTTINLSYDAFKTDVANNATSYTLTGTLVVGKMEVRLINSPTEPVVTGATKIKGSTFVANTNMYLKTQYNGTRAEYWLEQI